jgi:hypothetical protein
VKYLTILLALLAPPVGIAECGHCRIPGGVYYDNGFFPVFDLAMQCENSSCFRASIMCRDLPAPISADWVCKC